MKSMNRQFGKLMKKGPGDKATVGVLLKDFDDADKMLAKVILPFRQVIELNDLY